MRRDWIVKERLEDGHTWHALVIHRDSLSILCNAEWDNQWMGIQASWRLVTCQRCLERIPAIIASETQELEAVAE